MSAATRLEAALLNAAETLYEVVGMAVDPLDHYGQRVPVNGSPVARGEVPDAAWRAACFALDVLEVGFSIMDPESASVLSVEDGLAAMTRETA